MEATAKIFFETNSKKRNKDGLCPVRLRITYKRERKYYSIADKLKNNEYAFISEEEIEAYKKYIVEGGRNKIRERHDEYKRITDEAEDIIKSLPRFSMNQFDERFRGKLTKWDNVFEALAHHIKELRDDNRHGYAATYESTIRALKEFHVGKKYKFNDRRDKMESRIEIYKGGKKLHFIDITPTFLKKFERYLANDGKSKTTIGIYMRNLRVIFNLALTKHKIQAEYPFREYKLKTAEGKKRALAASDIKLIASYESEHPQKVYYRDLFMFSFLANGMNTADIAHLKYSNIDEGELAFIRQKTKGKRNEKSIKVPITESMQRIIDRHGNKTVGHDAYIFPILTPGQSEIEIYYTIKQFTKQMNKYIGQIADDLKLGKITTYTARHSWATISKNSGTSTEYIKEALGHSNVSVTENYLKSFEKSTRKQHSDLIEQAVYNKAN
jgi:integrase